MRIPCTYSETYRGTVVTVVTVIAVTVFVTASPSPFCLGSLGPLRRIRPLHPNSTHSSLLTATHSLLDASKFEYPR